MKRCWFRSIGLALAAVLAIGPMSLASAADDPAAEKPADDKIAADKAVADKAAADKPVADKAAAGAPMLLPVADVKRDQPIDFERDILPVLKKNCLACHSGAKAENHLSLETPQAILKGGDGGPAAIAKRGADSLLLLRARGGGDGLMPPPDNKVEARPLTPDELGLLRLWIDQGAIGAVSQAPEKIVWQPLPVAVNPIYAVAVSPDGLYTACGRANQVFLYHLPTGREVCRLTDPTLLKSGLYQHPGVADLDLIQSLAFSPDGQLLAAGGFQAAKLWQRPRNVRDLTVNVESPAQAAAISLDGKWLALGGEDQQIRLFELPGGKPGPVLSGHTAAVTGLGFATDGKLLYSGSADGSLRAWRLPEAAPAWRIDTPGPVNAVAILGNGPQVATGGADGQLRIWNPPADNPPPESPAAAAVELTGHSKPITALAALRDKPGQLYSGSEDGLLIVWDVGAKKAVQQMNHGGPIAAIAVRADGQRLASAGANKIAKLWNAGDGKQLAEMKGDARAIFQVAQREWALAAAQALVVSEKNVTTEGEKAAAAETEAVKKTTEARTAAQKSLAEKQAAAKQTAEEKAAADKAVEAAKEAEKKAVEAQAAAARKIQQAEAAMPIAKKLADEAQAAATNDKDNAALAEVAQKVRQVANEVEAKVKAEQEAKAAADKQVPAAAEKVKQETAAAQKKAEAVAAADKAAAEAQSAASAAERAVSLATSASQKAAERVKAAKDALQKAEEQVKQSEANLAKAREVATAAEHPLRAVAFSPDGVELATAAESGLIHTWSAESGAALDTYEGHQAAARALVYLGPRQLLSADKTAVVWNTLPAWTWQRTIGGPPALIDRVTTLDFSPDGRLLATGGGAPSRSGELKIWNVTDGALVRDLPDAHSDSVLGVRFSPDGSRLASGAADKFVKVFDVASGRFLRAFEGHTHHVLGVAWSSDGKLLASSGADNVVKVWEVASGEQKKTITGFGKEVTSVAFIGSSENLLAASGDKSVRIKKSSDGGEVRGFGGAGDFMYSAGITPDGKIVVAGGQDSVLRLWRADNGQPLRNFDPPPSVPASAAGKP